jgi:hypothetical protein
MKGPLADRASLVARTLPLLAYVVLAAAMWDLAAESPGRLAEFPQALGADKGREALPAEAVELKLIVAARGVPSFRLAAELERDDLIAQRIVEYLYPVRTDETSAFVVARAVEAPRGCRLVDRATKIVLNECPR